jgi:dTDP-4-amino-4,6-dideoxygalactose transaminase
MTTVEKRAASQLDLIAEPIQLFKPYHGEEEIEAVAEVLRSGWWGLGPKTVQFERDYVFSAVIRIDKHDQFVDWMREPLPVIERERLRCQTLPLHPNMSNSDVEYIIEVIRHFPHA